MGHFFNTDRKTTNEIRRMVVKMNNDDEFENKKRDLLAMHEMILKVSFETEEEDSPLMDFPFSDMLIRIIMYLEWQNKRLEKKIKEIDLR